MGFGDALLTQGTLENNSNDGLSLSGFNDWSGSGTCPNVTPAKLSLTFCHNADAQGAGSKGGVVYTVGNGGIKWVIAWSNMQNDENKVYVDITDTAVDWSAVKSSLENSSPNPSAVTKNGYTTTATIDANKNLPSFTATLGTKPKPKPKGSLNYQIKVMGFGDALLTQGTLENNSNDGLSLSGFNDWSGSGTCPNVTPAKLSLTFCHNADAQGAGSKGGVVYTVGNGGIKWVIAWSNMQNDENKVYVDITDTAVDWSAVKSSLENSSPNPSAVTKNGYTTTATIDANKNLPSFTATLGVSIFVENILTWMHWKGLWHLFARHEEAFASFIAKKLSIGRKRFGFVRFKNEIDAGRAMERINGFVVYGFRLTVKLAIQKERNVASKKTHQSSLDGTEDRVKSRSRSDSISDFKATPSVKPTKKISGHVEK
ncbi:hypothetical protein GQ457_14G021040 [Hibiscus cannabinus]